MTSPLVHTVHRLATWGEPDAEERVELWNAHVDDLLVESGRGVSVRTTAAVAHGVSAHVWSRLTGPRSTALPAGFAMAFVGFGPLVMWRSGLLPEIPAVQWVIMSLAFAASAFVLLSSPTVLHPRRFAAASSAVGASGLAAIWMLDVNSTIDWIVTFGWVIVAAGAFGASFAVLSGRRASHLFDASIVAKAAGSFVLGLGHTAWVSDGSLLWSSLFALVAGAVCTAGLLSIRALR